MRFVCLLSFLTLAACANNTGNECGDKFLIPWTTTGNVVEFKEVHLPTLNSPYKMKGAAAEIFYEGSLTVDGYSGSVAQPKLMRSGHVCVPQDAGSALALVTYAHFEQIYKLDRELGVDRQITWPRKVGIELRLRTPDGHSHNNAHYFGRSDTIGVLPYTLGATHTTLNRGILAHEHFHAHFQAQVLRPLSAGDDIVASIIEGLFYQSFAIKPVEDLDGADISTNSGLNRFVLRAWNEGLADFYGAVAAGEPDFFAPTLPFLSADRGLDGPVTLFRPGTALIPDHFALSQGELIEQKKNMTGLAYQQGTLLARLLYRIAQHHPAGDKAVLAHVMKNLKKVAAAAAPEMERRVMDFDMVVPPLIEGLTLGPEACAALRATISKQALLRRIGQCAH